MPVALNYRVKFRDRSRKFCLGIILCIILLVLADLLLQPLSVLSHRRDLGQQPLSLPVKGQIIKKICKIYIYVLPEYTSLEF